jgi:hypothetical protein
MSATHIPLNELPRYSRWPAILLGEKPFPTRQRTRDEVLREYDREKWGVVLTWLRAQSRVSMEDLLRAQGMEPERIIAYARDNQFFTAPAREVMVAYENLLFEKLRPHATGALAELGCGLGDKLLRMAELLKPKTVFGGEFTMSGVECGRFLAKMSSINAQFKHFDYNNPATLEAVPKHAMVFTSHSIEQIPNLSETFIAGLIRRAPRAVLHFEPDYEGHDANSLTGLMQRRYAELNDYNRNLWGLLKTFETKGQIRILEHSTDVFGINPFNSTSIFIWQPI